MANISRRKFIKGLALTAIPTPVLAANATSVSSGLSTTPAEIKGPFYPVTAQHDRDIDLTTIKGRDGGAEGDVIFVEGRVVDTQGAALEGAVIDLWQANAFGRYSHPRDPNPAARDPNFQGWAIFLSRSGGVVDSPDDTDVAFAASTGVGIAVSARPLINFLLEILAIV